MEELINRTLDPDPPIDTSLSDEEISEAICMVIMSNLPPEAFGPKPGEPIDLDDIRLEEGLKAREGKGPKAIPDDVMSNLRAIHDSNNIKPKMLLWGTGTPRREFLHVQDMAEACIFIMKLSDELYKRRLHPEASNTGVSQPDDGQDNTLDGLPSFYNIGSGQDHTIKELSMMVSEIVGYQGDIDFNSTEPTFRNNFGYWILEFGLIFKSNITEEGMIYTTTDSRYMVEVTALFWRRRLSGSLKLIRIIAFLRQA